MLAHLRSCPLSACFRASGFAQRPSVAKSIGNVVQRGQEVLAEKALTWPEEEGDTEFRRLARDVFDGLLAEERGRIEAGGRRIGLIWDTNRVRDARSAFILSATEFLNAATQDAREGRPLRERTIESPDGFFVGTPDLVIATEDDAVIIDFKTGSFRDQHALERYRAQVHVYAYIWWSINGIWPSKGLLKNPITGDQTEIPIESEEARAIAREAMDLIRETRSEIDVHDLARPGAACSNCDYRPWCEPYWGSEQSTSDATGAVVDAAVAGGPNASSNGWITLANNDDTETLTVRNGPPVLADITLGKVLRVIDPFRLPGSDTRLISAFTEVFVF